MWLCVIVLASNHKLRHQFARINKVCNTVWRFCDVLGPNWAHESPDISEGVGLTRTTSGYVTAFSDVCFVVLITRSELELQTDSVVSAHATSHH